MAENNGSMSGWGPLLIGLAYLAIVVFIIIFCAIQAKTFDEYAKYWALFATLVGVATGAIPSYFFKTQADQAKDQAQQQTQRADKEAVKAQLFAGIADPDKVETLRATHGDMFR